jgi:hypothetical protein
VAFTISHKIPVVGDASDVLEAIRDYFVANDARFEIIDQNGVNASNGWLAVRLVGGTGWDLWLGNYISGASTWAGANILGGSPQGWSLHYALGPAGGWSAGGDPEPLPDGPGGDMFSESPEGGAWWGKIRPFTAGQFFTADELHWLTIMDDPATGTLIILIDKGRNNSWDYGLLITRFDSRFESDDQYPVVALAGVPEISGATSWIFASDSPNTWSTILLPGDTTQGLVSQDGIFDLAADNQPNPVNGKYDLPQVGFKCDTAGIKHNRGLISAAALRQCSSGLGERTILGGGAIGSTWIVVNGAKRLALPWDGSITP